MSETCYQVVVGDEPMSCFMDREAAEKQANPEFFVGDDPVRVREVPKGECEVHHHYEG